MLYLILGCLVLLVLVTVGRAGRPVRLRPAGIRREWRFVSAAAAVAALTAALYLGVREAWVPALVLIALGLSFAGSARLNPRRKPQPPPPAGAGMSLEEARSILGVGPQASREEIQAAYSRLMRMAHPDKGGTTGLAAQLNAARDRLLGR